VDQWTLDSYLNALFAHLSVMPADERAEVILEIKSHVAESLLANPSALESEILDKLGGPQDVAARYLCSRGFASPPPKPEKTPNNNHWTTIVKWLISACVIICSFPFVFAAIVVFMGLITAVSVKLLFALILFAMIAGIVKLWNKLA
jgi:uncharacterized membrane protein